MGRPKTSRTGDDEAMDARSVDVGKCLSRGERGFAALIVVANLTLVGWLAAGAEFGGLMEGAAGDAVAVERAPVRAPQTGAMGLRDDALARAVPVPRR